MSKIKEYLIGALVGVLLVIVVGSFLGTTFSLGGGVKPGIVQFQVWGFTQGLTAGKQSQWQVTNAGVVSSSAAAAFANVTSTGPVTIGGTSLSNQLNVLYETTSTAKNGTTTAIVLGPFTASTSSASTTLDLTGLPTSKFTTGDLCLISLNVTSTSGIGFDCYLTSTATTTASATAVYWNAASSSVTIPTSTVARIELHHFGN